LGQAARPRPASESSPTPRSGAAEPAPAGAATEVTSSIKAWFSSTFSSFTGFGRSATNTETNEASANETTVKQSSSERSEQRKSQQSKAEQQVKASQSEPERKRSDTARAPSAPFQPSAPLQMQILEAAGDKFVPGAASELSEDEKRTAIEAVGDKDVFALQTAEEDWQKELYQQFLEWRIKHLMFHASDEKISEFLATRAN
jgi:hypothetical protein